MQGVNKDVKKMTSRINRILGQMKGIEKMILDDKYCIDIITQTSAIKSAISSLEDEMLQSHLAHCLHADRNKDKKTQEKMQVEIIKVYKLKRR